jgi:hypothetical protein
VFSAFCARKSHDQCETLHTQARGVAPRGGKAYATLACSEETGKEYSVKVAMVCACNALHLSPHFICVGSYCRVFFVLVVTLTAPSTYTYAPPIVHIIHFSFAAHRPFQVQFK